MTAINNDDDGDVFYGMVGVMVERSTAVTRVVRSPYGTNICMYDVISIISSSISSGW